MTRLYLLGIVALLLIATHTAVGVLAWRESAVRIERRHQAAGLRTFVDAVKQAADVGRDVLAIGQQLALELSASREHERTAVQQVGRIADANPDFAAMRRPAELQRLRAEQLARIARAAAEADRLR